MLTHVPGCARVGRVVVGLAMGFLVASGMSLAGCGDGGSVDVQRDLGPFIISGPAASGDMAQTPSPDTGTPVDLATSTAMVDLSTPSSGGCGSVDANGICNGNKLEYCSSSNMLTTKDCSSSSKVCSVSSSGYANCTSP
jgi:hypothetical protein